MFDPILQKDYYRVRALFEPHQVRIDRLPGKPDTKLDGLVRVYDANLGVPTYLYIRGDDRTPDKSKKLEAGVPENPGEVLSDDSAREPCRARLSFPMTGFRQGRNYPGQRRGKS